MSIVPFELPEELKGITADSIQKKMLAAIPDNVDKTEGGFVWDMSRPAALEAAELIQFWLVLALKNSFHQYASGRWLDYCAYDCGLERKEATYAYGDVVVTTNRANVEFPKGFVFSVPSENGSAAIDFETTEAHTCARPDTYTFRVKAVLPGPASNVKADTINIMKNPVLGVEDIINTEPLSGGTDSESDDSLRQRIDDYFAGRMASFAGNKKDYIRWAKEVDGVGYAHCIPTYDGPNTVKLVIADQNGDRANKEVLRAVELHIFGTGHNDINRLAPIGVAKYEVVAPIIVEINYAFDLKLSPDYELSDVENLIRENLLAHYKTLSDDDNNFGTLRYVGVSDVLYHTEGVADFRHLRVNGEVANVEFGEDKLPGIGDITITLYDDD